MHQTQPRLRVGQCHQLLFGGQWNRQQQVWEIRYDQVVALGLVDRIVAPAL